MAIQRRQQVLAKIETVEGTSASPGGSDAVQIFDPAPPQDTTDITDRVPAGKSLSRDLTPPGRATRAITFKTDFRGSGSTGTAPDFARFLQAAGFAASSSFRALTLGSVTGGAGFQAGEIVSQSAGAVRAVIVAVLSSANVPKNLGNTSGDKLIVAPIVGSTTAAATTGESSGCSSTASAAAAYSGFCYQPTSDRLINVTTGAWSSAVPAVGNTLLLRHASTGALLGSLQVVADNSSGAFTNMDLAILHLQDGGFDGTAANNELFAPNGTDHAVLNAAPSQVKTPSLTIRHNLDGRQRDLLGARGTFTLDGEIGQPLQFSWNFTGDKGPTVDAVAATTSGLSTVRPPRMLGMFAMFGNGDTLFRLPTKRLSLDLGATVSPNGDANRDGGSTGGLITDRDPSIQVTVDAVNGGFDWESALANATVIRLAFVLGTSQGNIVALVAPSCQVTEVQHGDADGTATEEVTLKPRRVLEAGDDELYIAQL